MSKKKGIVSIIAFVVIVCGIFFLSKFSLDATIKADPSNSFTEEDLQELLLTYADYGLTYDEETYSFYYDGQVVKKLVDDDYFHTNGNGTIQVSILRDSNGDITGIDVK